MKDGIKWSDYKKGITELTRLEVKQIEKEVDKDKKLRISLCYICGKPVYKYEEFGFETSINGRKFYYHKICDEVLKSNGGV